MLSPRKIINSLQILLSILSKVIYALSSQSNKLEFISLMFCLFPTLFGRLIYYIFYFINNLRNCFVVGIDHIIAMMRLHS